MAVVVLVHGTTSGGWVWKRIAPMLREAGHEVYAPTLTGLGERVHLSNPGVDLDTHVADVVNMIEFEDLEQVELVGHSYGGMVITGVADRIPHRIARLIYFDALVPHDGEAAIDLVAPEVRRHQERAVETEGHGWLIPVARGANDLPTHNTPHPFKTWTQPLKLGNPAASAIPRIYVRFTADKQEGSHFSLAMEKSWERVRTAGWPIYEVNTVHQIVPDPDPKARVLLDLLKG